MNTEAQTIMEPPVISDAATPVAPAPVAAKKRILLADDSPQIRESLSKVLRNAGYHVTLVAQGGQALDRALEEEFDLLLLDLNMPGMDGWETLDHLASLKPSLPVVIITAQPDQREWAEAEGARALMEKPLDLPLLLRTVRDFTTAPRRSAPARSPEPPGRFSFAVSEKIDFHFSESSRRWATN